MAEPCGESERLERYRLWNRCARPYFAWQLAQFAQCLGQRIADVGCGPGNLAPLLAERELYLAVDPDPAMLGEVRSLAPHASVETLAASVLDADFASYLQARAVDTVLCFNVLEHLQDDRTAAAHLVEALPAGGRLGILVPAHPFLYGSLDALDDHYRRYTAASLAALFDGFKMRTTALYHFNAIGAVGWWLKGRVLKERTHSEGNYAAMNRLLPVVRPLEAAVKPPFGLSLVLHGVKTG